MKKLYLNILAVIAMLCSAVSANAVGWPANYQGVMLQGFYWDSNNETSWTNLTAKADELSKYFSLIWVPNSAQSVGMPAMGYMPIYWFSHHNSSFGTEQQLKTMIETFKAKGTGIIEDVVVNHRAGVSKWYDFPAETWNGKTYQLTNGAICSTDEMWTSGGQGCPYTKGNPDTGDDFNGARDLDHTNPTVQDNVKNYCKFLIDELGYVGFRLDMVKGYGGEYTKIYNQYAKPQFCVGEYFDGSYDNCANWINATGKESAAFDFPCKFQINNAFHNNDMTQLVWNANGTTPQPAGLIHYGYQQFAVTFVENHDTYRDNNKFNGNVVAANAFILCSPGTPCVFWPHYTANKAAIQKLIDIRNEVGVHNMSAVKVLQTTRDCYMAEVTGTNGKLVVKIGSAMVSPSGYTDSQIKASGTDYCVWTTTEGGTPIPTDPFTVYYDNSLTNWTTPHIHYWGGAESKYPGVAMSKVTGNVWSYTVPVGTTGILFNAGDGDATKTSDFTAQENHIYNKNGDQGTYTGGGGGTVTPTPDKTLYVVGANNGWNTSDARYKMAHTDGTNIYTLTASGIFGGEWKICDGSWNWSFGMGDNLYEGVDNDCWYNGQNFKAISSGEVTVTFTLVAGSDVQNSSVPSLLKYTVGGGSDTGADLYLVGEFNSWSNPGSKFTYKGNNTYSLTIDKLEGEFKINDGTWEGINLGGDGGGQDIKSVDVPLLTNVTLWQGSSVNLKSAGWTNASLNLTYTKGAQTATLRVDGLLGAADLEIDEQPVEYFNLQGVRVDKPENGLFIVRQGNKVNKIYVK